MMAFWVVMVAPRIASRRRIKAAADTVDMEGNLSEGVLRLGSAILTARLCVDLQRRR